MNRMRRGAKPSLIVAACFAAGNALLPQSAEAQTNGVAWSYVDEPSFPAAWGAEPHEQYNTTGGYNGILRVSEGVWIHSFRGLGQSGGHVQVSSGWNGRGHCKVSRFWNDAGTEKVEVRCFAVPGGGPIDVPYTVIFFRDNHPGARGAYLWANDATSA